MTLCDCEVRDGEGCMESNHPAAVPPIIRHSRSGVFIPVWLMKLINRFVRAVSGLARWRQRFAERLLHVSWLLGAASVTLTGCARQPLMNLHDHLSFLDPQGPIAGAERWNFWFVIAVMGVLVAAPVFLLTVWIVWRYRYKNKDYVRYAPKWGDNRFLSIATWGGPVVIVIVLGFFAWQSTHKLNPWTPIASNQPALQVQAIGYDWKWLFIYPKQRIATIGVLPIPTGRPVAMKLTSATVMQSLWIPALVGQIYAMGGMTTELHFEAASPGRSLGLNTMYNGPGFHQQKFTTIAMKPGAFKAWIEHVKAKGVPMDGHTYKLIDERNTKAQLAAALHLPPKVALTGAFFIREVPPNLFHKVLVATARGTPVRLGPTIRPPVAVHLLAAKEPAPATPITEQ